MGKVTCKVGVVASIQHRSINMGKKKLECTDSIPSAACQANNVSRNLRPFDFLQAMFLLVVPGTGNAHYY